MKTILTLSILSLALLSCKKDELLSERQVFYANLDNSLVSQQAETRIEFKAYDGAPQYAEGKVKQAYHVQGEGDSLELSLEQPIKFKTGAIVSFWVQPEDWINPYKQGSGTQTILVLSGKVEKGWKHLNFNFDPHRKQITTSFDQAGDRLRISSKDDLNIDWYKVELRVNKDSGKTELFINDKEVAQKSAIPDIFNEQVSKIRLGTWYKKNQAFRGKFDELIIKELI